MYDNLFLYFKYTKIIHSRCVVPFQNFTIIKSGNMSGINNKDIQKNA